MVGRLVCRNLQERRPQKENQRLFEDPTGLDKALEEAKKAATEKVETEEKKEELRVETRRGPNRSVAVNSRGKRRRKRKRRLAAEVEAARGAGGGRKGEILQVRGRVNQVEVDLLSRREVFDSPLFGGGRTVAALKEKPRETVEKRDEGAEPVPGESKEEGLSISETGGLLALVCVRSGTNLGDYLKRSIKPGSDDGNSGRESGDFRKAKGLSPRATSWIAGLALFDSGPVKLSVDRRRQTGKSPPCHCSVSQARALDRIWETVKAFVDGSSESKSKVPRSRRWGNGAEKLEMSGFHIRVSG